MSILPSPPVRLPHEGEALRRVERETERKEPDRQDVPDRHGKHGHAEDEQRPDVEVDVSEEYVAEHLAHDEPRVHDSAAAPGAMATPHHIDIEA